MNNIYLCTLKTKQCNMELAIDVNSVTFCFYLVIRNVFLNEVCL